LRGLEVSSSPSIEADHRTLQSSGLTRFNVLLFVVITLCVVAAALAATILRPESYKSTAAVVVRGEQPSGGGPPVAPDMATEREIALSGNVEERASSLLTSTDVATLEGLDVDVPVDSNVLEISFTAGTAEDAYIGASVFTRAYINYRNELSTSLLDTPPLPVAEVITGAERPSEPVSKRYPLVVLISGLLGLVLAVAITLLRERLTGRLRERLRVQQLVGRPVLAEMAPSTKDGSVEDTAEGSAPRQEAYGELVARLLQEAPDGSGGSVLVTSATDVAGQSRFAANLSDSLAATGKQVVLVRRAEQPSSAPAGLDAERSSGAIVQSRETGPGVSVALLPPLSASSEETLPALRRVLAEIDPSAMAVINGDSVLAHRSTAIMADVADLTLLLVDPRHQTAGDLEAAVAALSHLDGRLLGCVLVDHGKRVLLNRFRWRTT
jgi:capsular polysaccharide biosynthesis protein